MKTLSDDTLEQVAVFLKGLGETTRLKILRAIHDEEKTVTQIIMETGSSQSNVSKHLSVLSATCLVTCRREGNSTYYRIADPNITMICDMVCRSIADQIRQSQTTLKNIRRGIAL